MNEIQDILAQLEESKQKSEIFNHPVIQNFFEITEKGLFDVWKASMLEDGANRERIFLFAKTMTSFKTYLQQFAVDQKLAEEVLQQLLATEQPPEI